MQDRSVGPATRQLDLDIGGRGQDLGVVAVATDQPVGPEHAVQRVVAVIPPQRVVMDIARDVVVACRAKTGIGRRLPTPKMLDIGKGLAHGAQCHDGVIAGRAELDDGQVGAGLFI